MKSSERPKRSIKTVKKKEQERNERTERERRVIIGKRHGRHRKKSETRLQPRTESDENKREAGRYTKGDMDRVGGRKDGDVTVMNLLIAA